MRYLRLLLLLVLIFSLAAPALAQAPAGDADGDGILDDVDQCPQDAANGSTFPPDSPYYGCPDRDGDGVADSVDACPDDSARPDESDPDRPGCPTANCIVDFAGSQTFAWPSFRAPVKNPTAMPGRYAATARTRDNLWWLLQGTDWVQGVPLTRGTCPTVFVFEPIPEASCGPVVSHVVAPGETLSIIAGRYGMAAGPIATANLLTNPDRIEVGQALIIPCPAPATPAPPPTAVPPTVVPPTPMPPTATPTPAVIAPEEPALTLPTIPITTASVAGVSQLFTREFIGFPYDLHLFGSGLEETLSFVTDSGLVIFYALVAPETMPGSLVGAEQRIFQYAATRSEVLAAAEPDAAGGTTVSVNGLPDGSPRSVPIPPQQGAVLTDLALAPELLITTSGTLSSVDAESGVRAWALATGAAAAFIPHPDPVTGVAVSPDGGLLASASLDGTVRVFDLRAAGGTPALLAQFNDGAAGIAPLNGGSSLAFSPDNRLLAVGGSDGFARLWVIASGELLAKLPHGAGSQVLAAAFSLDGSVLATGGGIHPGTPGGPFLFQDTTLYLWDVAALQDGTGAMAVRPAGPWRLDGHLDAVTGLAFSANGTLLVSIGADGTFRLWGVLS